MSKKLLSKRGGCDEIHAHHHERKSEYACRRAFTYKRELDYRIPRLHSPVNSGGSEDFRRFP